MAISARASTQEPPRNRLWVWDVLRRGQRKPALADLVEPALTTRDAGCDVEFRGYVLQDEVPGQRQTTPVTAVAYRGHRATGRGNTGSGLAMRVQSYNGTRQRPAKAYGQREDWESQAVQADAACSRWIMPPRGRRRVRG